MPIIFFIVSPANNSHCMTACHISTCVMVYPSFVIIKIFPSNKSCHYRSIFINISLNFFNFTFNSECTWFAVIFLEFLSCTLLNFTFKTASICLFQIWKAGSFRDSFCRQKISSWYHITTTTPIIFEGAINNILGRQLNIDSTFRLYAQAVSKNSCSYKSPASTAESLVKNNRFTHWIFISNVVIIR